MAYCRVSTLDQTNGYGLDIQRRDIDFFADRQGFLVARFYQDEGESGVRENRTALRRLLRECARKRVGTIVIPALDRLSRNVRLAENLFHRFEQLGITVLIADMPTYNGKNRKDVLVRQIREAIAEDNRKDIIERLWKGRQERVRQGLPPGGNVAYGFRRRAKSLMINQAEAAIVRAIFDSAARGESQAEIARILGTKGFRQRNGRPWTQRRVGAILARRALYAEGVLRYGEIEGRAASLVLLRRGRPPNGSEPPWRSGGVVL